MLATSALRRWSFTSTTTHLGHAPGPGMPATVPMSRYASSSALEWLASFTNYEQRGIPAAAGTDSEEGFDLGRMHRLTQALGSPQSSWPAVHVAGTKGKGSAVAMLSSILSASGYKVGAYSSPHVVSLHERIAVAQQPISTAALDALVAQHAPTIEAAAKQELQEGSVLTHFEILTALAFRHFEDAGVDVAVVEVGLGGARDATNVLPADNLAAAVVTAVGSDHVAALGGSLEKIATSKAGIMKPGRSAVLARQPEAAAAAILVQHAESLKCEARQADVEISVQAGPVSLDPDSGAVLQLGSLSFSPWAAEALGVDPSSAADVAVRLRLVGAQQLDNAAAAATTAAVLKSSGKFPGISLETVVRGVETASLPGRFQLCRLRGTAEEGDTNAMPWVVLDGAHTPESAESLVATLRAAFPSSPVALVLAMASDKDHKGVCAALRHATPAVVAFTEVAVAGARDRAASPGSLAAAWQAAGMASRAAAAAQGKGLPMRARELIQASLPAAVARSAMELRGQHPGERGVVVVTGSLHAVGAALKQLDLKE